MKKVWFSEEFNSILIAREYIRKRSPGTSREWALVETKAGRFLFSKKWLEQHYQQVGEY